MTVFLSVFLLLLFLQTTAFAAPFLVKEGMRGEDVRTVQTLLIQKGFLEGPADGICGKVTAAAIRNFQKENGLTVDGICGQQTYARLRAATGPAAEKRSEEQSAPVQGQVVYVSATGYSAYDPGNKPTTASGTLVRHGVIAVDPAFIALGTRVFIPGYGEAVAEDIGWGIRGNTIDIAFDTHEEALAFGRQNLEIYILE